MDEGQRISLTALNGATVDGVYVRPLTRNERKRLFDNNYERDTEFAWVETQQGRGWFDARRLVTKA